MVSGGKSPAELDMDAIDKFNRLLKKDIEREARLIKQFHWRGNKLPPFAIEPLPSERQRLANGGMTPEERALRKQWVMDQKLAPNEPVYVKELYPKNIIRRVLAAPWDFLFSALKPIVGKNVATYGRFYTSRAAMGLGAAWIVWYQFKYNRNMYVSTLGALSRWGKQWTGHQGFHMYRSKPIVLPGDPAWPNPMEKEYDEFHDRGFKQRTIFRDDIKTSMVD